MLTKFGLSAWSCQPPATPYTTLDVSAQARAATQTVEVDAEYAGPATTLTYTVAADRNGPIEGIVIAATPAGTRSLATTTDPAMIDDMLHSEWCARSIDVSGSVINA
jgi:acetyl-CoA C-acetyltransferase